MRELFLHIGSHKTGTTSIQKACERRFSGSSRRQASYLNLRPGGTQLVEIGGRGPKFSARILMEVANALFTPADAEQDGRFILSDEAFFWIDRPDTVVPFARLLQQRFERVTILCYLRRQDLLAVSHRKQVNRQNPAARFYGLEARPLPAYRPYFDRYFDYAAKLADVWVPAFGKESVQVVCYDAIAQAKADVVDDFAVRVGIDFNLKRQIRANRSPDGNRTMVGLTLAELGLPREARQKILNAMPGAGKFLPTRDEARAFLAHFEESNARLEQAWSRDGVPFRFNESFDMYPEAEGPRWTDAEVQQMVRSLVQALRSAAAVGSD